MQDNLTRLIKGALLAMLCFNLNPGFAQTVIWGKDLVSRNNTTSDRIACQYLANEVAPVSLIADDYVVQPNIHHFSIHAINLSSMVTATISNAILADASFLLNQDDGAGDVSCGITMQREGDITLLTPPTGVIGGVVSNESDRVALITAAGDQAGDVVIVSGLTTCGSSVGTFAGCAAANRAMVVTTSASSGAWAHEFGHVQFLGHNPDDTSTCGDSGDENIMFPVACPGIDKVSSNECSSYYRNARC